MEVNRFLKRVVERYAFFAPFCGILGSVYGIYRTFDLMGQLESSHAVAPGIWSALLCTAILMPLLFLIVVVYTLLLEGIT
jgi:biopolymer transport protein ExbB/TolQ